MLSIENLQVNYNGIPALHGVSLELKPGEIVALLGNNGAGKSSTLRAVSGMVSYQGKILYQGQDLKDIPAYKRMAFGIAHVPEGRGIFSDLTVAENLKLATWGAKHTDITIVFELFPKLRERKQQLASTLSGGEQQMLAIGRALMRKPSLLLLDEPSMGLAPALVEEVFKTLQNTHQLGVSILLVEQNACLAFKVASRAYILETGNVALMGSSQALMQDTRVKDLYLSG